MRGLPSDADAQRSHYTTRCQVVPAIKAACYFSRQFNFSFHLKVYIVDRNSQI